MANIDSVAGPQRDGTQGIAKVEFKNADDSVVKVIPACAVYIPKDSKSANTKYMLNLHTKSSYYVIGPWFKEVRPQKMFNKVTVAFHRFRKPSNPAKEFSISFVESKSPEFVSNSNSFIIACKGENFESSTFLKHWSSKVVLYRTPSDIHSKIINSFWGFKKVHNDELKKNLFYYTKIDIKCTRNAQDFTIGKDQYGTLTESGLILFQDKPDKPDHYNVVGCYKKESSKIQISCLHSAEMLSVDVVDSQHQGENLAAAQTGNENAQQRAPAPSGVIIQTENNHEQHAKPEGTTLDDSHPEQQPRPDDVDPDIAHPGNISEEQSQRVAPGAVEPDGNNSASQPQLNTEHDNFVQGQRVAPGAVQPLDGNNTASQPVDPVAEQDNLVQPSQTVTSSQTDNSQSQQINEEEAPEQPQELDGAPEIAENGQQVHAQEVEDAPLVDPLVSDLVKNKNLIDRISLMLDQRSPVVKNWENLASELHAPQHVIAQCRRATQHSPTELLFDTLSSSHKTQNLTINELITKLNILRRNDAVNLLKEKVSESERGNKVSEVILSNNGIMEELSTLLDKESRVTKNWYNLGLELGLTKEILHEIKNGNDPSCVVKLFEYIYITFPELTVEKFKEIMNGIDRKDMVDLLLGINPGKMKEQIPLDTDMMRSICYLLNKNSCGSVKDWKHLAVELGIDYLIYSSFKKDIPESPTKVLLDWVVIEKPNITLSDLCKNYFKKIKRFDVIEIVELDYGQSFLPSN